jgi:hypothetical protein
MVVSQVVQHLPSQHEVLRLNFSTAKQTNKTQDKLANKCKSNDRRRKLEFDYHIVKTNQATIKGC